MSQQSFEVISCFVFFCFCPLLYFPVMQAVKSFLGGLSIHKSKWEHCEDGAGSDAGSLPWSFPSSEAGGGAGFQSWSRICWQRPAHPQRTVNTEKTESFLSYLQTMRTSTAHCHRERAVLFLEIKCQHFIIIYFRQKGTAWQLLLSLRIIIYIFFFKLAVWFFRLASLNRKFESLLLFQLPLDFENLTAIIFG